MEADADFIRETASGNRVHTVKSPASWVARHGKFNEVVENVHAEFSFALIKGTDLPNHGHSWGQLLRTTIVYFLQYLILCIEDKDMGAPALTFSKVENPARYKAVIKALAALYCNRAKKQDLSLIKKFTMGSHYCNIEIQTDIRDAMKKLIEGGKKKKRKTPDSSSSSSPDSDEDDDESHPMLDEEAEEQGIENIPLNDVLPRLCFVGMTIDADEDDFSQLTGQNLPGFNLSSKDRRPFASALFSHYRNLESASSPASAGDEADNEAEGLEWLRENPDLMSADMLTMLTQKNKILFPKAMFTVTTIPSMHAEDEVLGYLVRIFQLDSTWNPGHLRAKLEEAVIARKRFASSRTYRDPYEQYLQFMGTNHPVFYNKRSDYIDMALKLTNKRMDLDLWNKLAQSGSVGNYASELHPRNLLTLERALDAFRKAGASNRLLDPKLYRDAEKHTAFTPPALQRNSFRYLPDQVFWTHDTCVGLKDQFFPDYQPTITRISHAAYVDDVDDYDENDINLDMVQSQLRDLYELCAQRPIMNRNVILERIPRELPFHTNDAFIHLACEADHYEKQLVKLFPENALEILMNTQQHQSVSRAHRNAYKKYCKYLNGMQDKFIQELKNIFFTDKESIKFLPVSKAVRALIMWYYVQKESNPTFKDGKITFDLTLFDPKLDFMSNALIQDMFYIAIINRIGQPAISMLLRGLFSVYKRRDNQLLYNICAPGDANFGKSFTIITYFHRMGIPGTITKIDTSTSNADLTDSNIMDEIRLYDELQAFKVNKKESAKHEDRVNQTKSAFTSGILVKDVFEFKDVPGVGRLRGSRKVVTAQNYTEAGCTNSEVEETPLISRYNVITMKISQIPVTLLNYKVSGKEKVHNLNYFRIKQYMSCVIYKAQMIGAIARDIDSELFYLVTNKMMDYLNSWRGYFQNAARPLEIIKNYGEQLIVEHAYHQTYNVKGAKYYGKPFELDHLRELQRYLYWSVKTIYFTVTTHIHKFADEDAHNVFEAVCNMFGINPNDTTNLYEVWCNDPDKRVPFLTYDNDQFVKSYAPALQHHNGGGGGGGGAIAEIDKRKYNLTGSYYKRFVDLNYVMLAGVDLAQAAEIIAPYTQPQMSVTNVRTKLEQKTHERYIPRHGPRQRNGYGPVGESWLLQHKKTLKKKLEYDATTMDNQKDFEFMELVGKRQAYQVLSDIDGIADIELSSVASQEALLQNIFGSKDWKNVAALYLIPKHTRVELSVQTLKAAVEQQFALPITHLSDEEVEQTWNAIYGMDNFNIQNFQDKRRRLEAINGFNCVRARILIHGAYETQEIRRKNTPDKYLSRPVLDTTQRLCHGGRSGCEDDVPQVRNTAMPADGSIVTEHHSLAVVRSRVKITRGNKKAVAINLSALEQYNHELVIKALLLSTTCFSTEPGKFLLGLVHPEDQRKYQTLELTQQDIRDYITAFEESDDMGNVSRMNGIGFRKMGFVDESTAKFLNTNVVRQEKTKVIADLDYYAAARQHVRCGFPLDEPVHDFKFLKHRYRQANGEFGTCDYPQQYVNEMRELREKTWVNDNSATGNKVARENVSKLLASMKRGKKAKKKSRADSRMLLNNSSIDVSISF